MINLITNNSTDNHLSRITDLLLTSDKTTLCSGWCDGKGIKLIRPALISASLSGAEIQILTSQRRTKVSAIKHVQASARIEHYLSKNSEGFCHSKFYLFEKCDGYVLIVGSANLTESGLTSNDELSMETQGIIGDTTYREIHTEINRIKSMSYLTKLPQEA